MPHRSISLLIFALATTYISGTFIPEARGQVLGAEATRLGGESTTSLLSQVKTETAFDQKEDLVVETIPYETEYQDDPEVEYGSEEVVEEGENGTSTLTYLITFWGDEEIDRQLVNTAVVEPKTEIISKGTKVVWKLWDTGDPSVGRIWYWYKMSDVWATKYDANCLDCWGLTYSGTEVKKGVCATDPSVIPLGTNFYVKGYGNCRAEDIGGAIKGNKIDLGYENAAEGDWSTGPTTIYLTSNAPDGSSKY